MLYFIGYNLDDKSSKLVDELRLDISKKFSVVEALHAPPHLTLFYPFEMKGKDEKELLIKVLDKFFMSKSCFNLKTTGFNYFDKAVWFIDVEQKIDLFDLKKELESVFMETLKISEDRKGRTGTHFHITVAYKDVTPQKFKLIGEYLSIKDVPINILKIDGLTLFEYQEKKWQPIKKFDFAYRFGFSIEEKEVKQ